MKEKGGLNILDALENLNTLVDADSLDEIELSEDALLIPRKGAEGEERGELFWMKAGPNEETLAVIRETFRSVHAYLQTFYAKMKKGGDTKRLVEGINTVMVLVGEAAKKLETMGTLFKQRIAEFEEYKQLQNFYRNRVIKESFREFAKIPIPHVKGEVLPEQKEAEEELQALLGEEEVQEIAGVHLLNDLEVIKRDHLYELFYLTNEAGHHFYTYELARNIKLACDFGEYTEEYFGEDPLLQIKNWEDKILHLKAETLLKRSRRLIEKFYEEALHYKEMDLVVTVHNALMALMLASNPRNLIRQFSLKGCHLYFNDFLLFLRSTLLNREYQKFVLYSPPVGQPFFQTLLELVNSLCAHLYTLPAFEEEIGAAFKQIVARVQHHPSKLVSEELAEASSALREALKKHPNGPVFKAVDIVREEESHIFDALHQGNIPSTEVSLERGGEEITILRMACPTIQEMINHANVVEEFKTLLLELDAKKKLLMINFQDRTSWREHARSLALEDLARQAEFAESLSVVTLAKETDFYNQTAIYQELDDVATFIHYFYDHLGDEATGYYFPPFIKKVLFPGWIKEMLSLVHENIFEGKKQLSFLERLDFIELAYHFISWKLIEITQPNYLCFCSKDGLDISATSSVGFTALLGIVHHKRWKQTDFDRLNTLLFGPTLMIRERSVHPERLERLISMIALLESRKSHLKNFAPLFEKEVWELAIKL